MDEAGPVRIVKARSTSKYKSRRSLAMISFGHPALKTHTLDTVWGAHNPPAAADPDLLKSTPAACYIRYSTCQTSRIQI
jgi:hypothetical protein